MWRSAYCVHRHPGATARGESSFHLLSSLFSIFFLFIPLVQNDEFLQKYFKSQLIVSFNDLDPDPHFEHGSGFSSIINVLRIWFRNLEPSFFLLRLFWCALSKEVGMGRASCDAKGGGGGGRGRQWPPSR
jgi:hypothetical protein